MHYLRKLKIVLQFSNIFIIILFSLYLLRYLTYTYNYSSNKNIYGKIIDYKKNDYKTSITIKKPNNDKLLITIDNNKINCQIKYGNYVHYSGEYIDINSNTIPNNFNYKNYLKSKKIFQKFKANSCRVIHGSNLVYSIKNNIYKRINKLKSRNYINAILLGNKSLLSEEEYTSLKDNNIMHLFAISGMHVSFLISLIDTLLKKFNKNIKSIIAIIVIFFYSFLVGFLASILRVLLYLIIDYICSIFNIKISKIKKLIICCLLLLIYNPFYIYDLGFIYSFTLMFFIYHFSINDSNRIKSYLKMILLTFLVSAPITIYNFYHLNFLSLLTNIIFIPIISMFIFPLALLTCVIPYLDNILYFFFSIIMRMSIYFSKITLLNIVIAKPPIILIVIYYILLLFHHYKRCYFKIIIISIMFYLNNYFNIYNKVIFLDVGQGDSSLIISPFNKQTIMIDTGGIIYSNYHISDNIITYLNSMGISKIETLIITHGGV